MTRPCADEVRKLLAYDPETGRLTWRVRPGTDRDTRAWNTRYAGKPAGSLTNDGYVKVSVCGQTFLAHRIAWSIATGNWPDCEIDHKDGNGLNNSFSNLRTATRTQNMANAKRRSDNSTGWKGVSRARGRYAALIRINSRKIHLGCFATPEEAHAAYVEAAKKYRGEFARPG
jgi:hypothetical protein